MMPRFSVSETINVTDNIRFRVYKPVIIGVLFYSATGCITALCGYPQGLGNFALGLVGTTLFNTLVCYFAESFAD